MPEFDDMCGSAFDRPYGLRDLVKEAELPTVPPADSPPHPANAVVDCYDALKKELQTNRSAKLCLPRDAGFDLWATAIALSWMSDPKIPEEASKRLLAYVIAEIEGDPISCPVERRLRSLYLAGVQRGMLNLEGARPSQFLSGLFDTVKTPAGYSCPNLCVDGVPKSSGFAAEFALLARDKAAYRRDILRAQRLAAFLPQRHGGERKLLEAVWIQDPESFLFVDRAWADRTNPEENQRFKLVIVTEGDITRIALHPKSEVCLDSLQSKLRGEKSPRLSTDSPTGWWTLRTRACYGDVERALHEELEGPLFKGGATWETDFGLLKPKPVKSEEIGSEKFKFCVCELENGLEAKIQRAAVKPIGFALSSLVRDPDDKRKGVVPDFESKHLQGDSGLLTVWTRYGFAAAYCADAGKQTAERLEETIRDLLEISKETDRSFENNGKPEKPDAQERLYRRSAKLQVEMTKPGKRLLRRLFETRNFAAQHQALYEIQTQAEMLKNAEATVDIQHKVEFIELAIIAFYAFEFAHIIAEAAARHWGWPEGMAGMIGVAIAILTLFCTKGYILEHQESPQEKKKRVALWWLVVLLVGGLVLSCLTIPRWGAADQQKSPKGTLPSAPAAPGKKH